MIAKARLFMTDSSYVLDLLLDGKQGLHVTGEYKELKLFYRDSSRHKLPLPWIHTMLTRYVRSLRTPITTPLENYNKVPFAKLAYSSSPQTTKKSLLTQNYYYSGYDNDDKEEEDLSQAEILERIDFREGSLQLCKKLTTLQYIWEALYKAPNLDHTPMEAAFKAIGNGEEPKQIDLALHLSRIFRAQFWLDPASSEKENLSEMKKLVALLSADFPVIFKELLERGQKLFELPTNQDKIQQMILYAIPMGTFVVPLVMDHIFHLDKQLTMFHQLSAVSLAVANADLFRQIPKIDCFQKVLVCMNFLVDAIYHHNFERYQEEHPITGSVLMLFIAAHFLLTLLFMCTPEPKRRVNAGSLLVITPPTYLLTLISFYFASLRMQDKVATSLVVNASASFIADNGIKAIIAQPGVAKIAATPTAFVILAGMENIGYQMTEWWHYFKSNSQREKMEMTSIKETQTQIQNTIADQGILEINEKLYLSTLAEFLFSFVLQKIISNIQLPEDAQLITMFGEYCTINQVLPHVMNFSGFKNMQIAVDYMQYIFMTVLSSKKAKPFVHFVDHLHFDKTLVYAKILSRFASLILKMSIHHDQNHLIAQWIQGIPPSNRQLLDQATQPTLFKLPHPSLFEQGTLVDLHNATITKTQIENLSDTEYTALKKQLETFYQQTTTTTLASYLKPNTAMRVVDHLFPAILLTATPHGHVLMDSIFQRLEPKAEELCFATLPPSPPVVDDAYTLATLRLPNPFIEGFLKKIHERIMHEFTLAGQGFHRVKAHVIQNYSPPFRLIPNLLKIPSQKLKLQILRLSHQIAPMPLQEIFDLTTSTFANTTKTVSANQLTLINLSIQKHPYFWVHMDIAPSKRLSIEQINCMVQQRTVYAALNGIFAFPTPSDLFSLLQSEMSSMLVEYYKVNPDIYPSMLIQSISQTALLISWKQYSHDNLKKNLGPKVEKQIESKKEQLRHIFQIGQTLLKIDSKQMKVIATFLYDYFKLYDQIPPDKRAYVNHVEHRGIILKYYQGGEQTLYSHQFYSAGPSHTKNLWTTVDPAFVMASDPQMFNDLNDGLVMYSTSIFLDVFKLIF